MKRTSLVLCSALAGSYLNLTAQTPAWQPPPSHITLALWPNGAPGAPSNPAPEVDTTSASDKLIAGPLFCFSFGE